MFICWSFILLKEPPRKYSVWGFTRVQRVTYKVRTNPTAQLALNPQAVSL